MQTEFGKSIDKRQYSHYYALGLSDLLIRQTFFAAIGSTLLCGDLPPEVQEKIDPDKSLVTITAIARGNRQSISSTRPELMRVHVQVQPPGFEAHLSIAHYKYWKANEDLLMAGVDLFEPGEFVSILPPQADFSKDE